MYLEFYDLKYDPFPSTAKPPSLFLSRRLQGTFQTLLDGLKAGEAFALLMGEAGLGKTCLLHAVLAHSALQHVKAIHVAYPKLSFTDILTIIGWEFGVASNTYAPETIADSLYNVLLTERKRGRQVLVVVDEAHAIPPQTLESLLRFANPRNGVGEPLFQVVLAGLPQLWHYFDTPLLQPFTKRLTTCLTLAPLTYTESVAYIRHCLVQSQATKNTIFTARALRKVARYARGNPRVINVLCTDMLVTGFFAKQKPVSSKIVQEILRERRGERPAKLWRRGVVYAASLLVLVSLVGGLQYGQGAFFAHHYRALLQRTRGFIGIPSVDTAQPPIAVVERSPLLEITASPPQTAPSLPIATPETSAPALQVTPLPETSTPPPLSPPTMPAAQTSGAPPAETTTPEGPTRVLEQLAPQPGPRTPVVPSQTAWRTASPEKSPSSLEVIPSPAIPQVSPPHTPPAKGGNSASRVPRASVEGLPLAETARRENRMPAAEQPTVRHENSLPGVISQERQSSKRLRRSTDILAAKRGETPSQSPEHNVTTPHEGAPRAAEAALRPDLDRLWPEGAMRPVIEAGGHAAVIRELIFAADGRELISVSDDKTIRVWRVSSDGQHAVLGRTIRGHIGDGREGMLAAAALSPPDTEGRQRWLAVGGLLAGTPRDRYAIRLHDYASGEVVGLLRGHDDAVLTLAFSPTGRWLASAGKDGTVRLWDLMAPLSPVLSVTPFVLTEHTDHIYDLAWSTSGDRLASAAYDRTVGLWNTAQLPQGQVTLLARLHGHDDQVQTVAFHPDGTPLASGGKDQTIRLWQASDGKALGIFARPKHKVSALSFAPDGRLLLAGNFSPPQPERLTLLAYPSGKTHHVFTGHQNLVVATAFHPSGQWIASGGGEQKEILLWRVQTGEVLSRLEGKGRTIYAVGFSPDGRYLRWGYTAHYTSANHQGPLEHCFDLPQLIRLPHCLPGTPEVRALEQVGTITLSAEQGGAYGHHSRLHVRNGTRRLSTIERGSTDGYRHSAYTLTPDGQGVLSGGMHGVLRLYALNGTLRADLLGHTGEIKAVAVSTDGRWALSGANDQTVSLWSLTEGLQAGRLVLTPTLTLFPTIDNEWVAWTPEGNFTASPHGARLLGYSINQGFDKMAIYLSGEQLRGRFYRPEMIHEKLSGDPR